MGMKEAEELRMVLKFNSSAINYERSRIRKRNTEPRKMMRLMSYISNHYEDLEEDNIQ